MEEKKATMIRDLTVGLAVPLGFGLKWACFGFWMGDALAGFVPFCIGTAFYLSGRWRDTVKA